jgi:HK97 gp10 family phage protein
MPFKSASGRGTKDGIDQFVANLVRQSDNALLRGALMLESNIKQILLTPGRGRIRESGRNRVGRGSFTSETVTVDTPFSRRIGPGIPKTTTKVIRRMRRRGRAKVNIDLTNRASAPGEPPAPDTGTLQRSITHDFDGQKIRVGTNVEYAEPLEFGTTNAGRSHNVVILPRPFMRPAYAASKEQITDAIVATLKRGTKRGN